MIKLFQSIFNLINSLVQGIIHFISYIPKLFEFISEGSSTLLSMFNYLPEWIFVIGSLTIGIAVIWIIVEII